MIRPSVKQSFIDRSWRVYSKQHPNGTSFDTWQEAMDHADKQARTVTAALPRVGYGECTIADKGLYSLRVDHREHCTDITLGGWDGVTVENSHLRGLSVYLAACATHWEAHQ